MKKVWTGRYWMTEKHIKKISNALKRYYFNHIVWNKGKKFIDEDWKKKMWKDKNYRLKILKENADRGMKNGHYLTKKKIKQIVLLRAGYNKKTGAGRKARRWDVREINYLRENYKTNRVLKMAIELKRSWSSVEHKLNRLGLTNYLNWNK